MPLPRLLALAVAPVAALVLGLGPVVLSAAPALAASPTLDEARTFTVAEPRATGYGLDLDGDLAAYTGSFRSSSAAGTGLVQVARRSGPAATDWTTTDLPVPADVRGYGVAVAVDEATGRAAVGAITSQQVVVYTRTGPDAWEVEQVLTAPADPRVGMVRSFGESLAIEGDTLVVGAPNSTVDGRANAGLAYVADLAAGTVTPLLPDPGLVVGDAIAGQGVALADGRIAVGAPQLRRVLDFYGGEFRLGGVYLWDAADLAAGASLTTQPVGPEMRSVPPSTGGGAGFGYALALVGDRMYVGSPVEVNYTADDPADPTGGYNAASIDAGTTTQGAVYVYDTTDPAAPARIGGKLMPPAHSWGFGYRIDATADALLASAYRTADDSRGEVHVLDPAAVDPATPDDGGLLRQTVVPAQTLRGSDMEPGARFGSSVIGGGLALSGERAIVAAFATGVSASGKVYLFEPVGVEPVEITVPDVTVTYGQTASLTATVDGFAPARAAVTIDGADVAGATLADGTVTLDLPPAAYPVGDHTVSVAVHQDGEDEPVAVGTATLRVLRAATTTTVGPTGAPAAGAALPLDGTVVAEHGTVPTGDVEIVLGETVVGTAQVAADGGFTAEVPAGVVVGTVALEARYAGDANHLPSVGAAEVGALAPGPTPDPDRTPGPDPAPDPDPTPAPDPTLAPDPVPTPGVSPAPPTAPDAAPPTGFVSQVLAVTGPGGLAATLVLAAAALGGGFVLVRRARRD